MDMAETNKRLRQVLAWAKDELMMDFECAYCGEATKVENESIRDEFDYPCDHCGKTNLVSKVEYLTATENDED